MQIYHCNFGYPHLSETAQLVLSEERETVPRTEFARTGLGRECEFDPPIDGEEERVFFQKMRREFWTRLENSALGVNMTMIICSALMLRRSKRQWQAWMSR